MVGHCYGDGDSDAAAGTNSIRTLVLQLFFYSSTKEALSPVQKTSLPNFPLPLLDFHGLVSFVYSASDSFG